MDWIEKGGEDLPLARESSAHGDVRRRDNQGSFKIVLPNHSRPHKTQRLGCVCFAGLSNDVPPRCIETLFVQYQLYRAKCALSCFRPRTASVVCT